MTTTPNIIDEAEAVLQRAVEHLRLVHPGECLLCYVWRQLGMFSCDGTLRHALHYRDDRAPRATALAERLGRVGGYCDCEVFMNGYQPAARFWTPWRYVEENGDVIEIEPEPIEPLPRCGGVRLGSARPCTYWVRTRRGF